MKIPDGQNIQSFFDSFYPQIIDSLPVPVYCLDVDSKLVLCNTAFERIIGKSKEEIYGKSTLDITPFNQPDIFSIKDKELLETGIDQFYEADFKYSESYKGHITINKSALRNDKDEISGIVCTIIDVTKRKKLEDKLKRSEAGMLISSTMLQKIRAGIVIVSDEMKIIESNLGFARLIGGENEELYETIPGLRGAELEMLVPGVISDMFRSIFETGENRIDRDIRYQNKLLAIEIATIQKHKIAGALIRDLSAPMLERAEIIERARQVNRKNMKTVQQIAYLLGENAAQTEELLNSIIESQKYSHEEND
jgi:PAS domain S-box-containing protein